MSRNILLAASLPDRLYDMDLDPTLHGAFTGCSVCPSSGLGTRDLEAPLRGFAAPNGSWVRGKTAGTAMPDST